ncbi:MAG: DEAD/DEAH box helicase [Bacteroidales bacterium]|nr:DEAD/DEAH box helicase [Bacteroidales bacterium]
MKFKELNLHQDVFEGISSMGFEEATPIQENAIPSILENKDIIACAQTGTGKTAAYLIPILHKLSTRPSTSIDTLILVPTRELALQIDQQLEGFSYFLDISSVAIYGGGDADTWSNQKNAILKGTNILIATPGRLIAHLNFGYVKFDNLKHLILDEADRMLDMGFNDDIMKIIKHLPTERQTLMFSATMPDKIRTMAKKTLQNPVEINLALSKPAEGILQVAYLVYDENKVQLIRKLVEGKDLSSILIFSATKKNVKKITATLKDVKFVANEIHSDLEQAEREQVLLDFRNRKSQVLVATDIVSRGIDITGIDLVINFDVPGDAEDYVHRVGRTARAQSSGVAITFINEADMGKFQKIEELIEMQLIKLPTPKEIGESPEYAPGKDRRPKRNFYKHKKKPAKK